MFEVNQKAIFVHLLRSSQECVFDFQSVESNSELVIHSMPLKFRTIHSKIMCFFHGPEVFRWNQSFASQSPVISMQFGWIRNEIFKF